MRLFIFGVHDAGRRLFWIGELFWYVLLTCHKSRPISIRKYNTVCQASTYAFSSLLFRKHLIYKWSTLRWLRSSRILPGFNLVNSLLSESFSRMTGWRIVSLSTLWASWVLVGLHQCYHVVLDALQMNTMFARQSFQPFILTLFSAHNTSLPTWHRQPWVAAIRILGLAFWCDLVEVLLTISA